MNIFSAEKALNLLLWQFVNGLYHITAYKTKTIRKQEFILLASFNNFLAKSNACIYITDVLL